MCVKCYFLKKSIEKLFWIANSDCETPLNLTPCGFYRTITVSFLMFLNCTFLLLIKLGPRFPVSIINEQFTLLRNKSEI